jgi:hypothetical protein
LEKRAEQVLPGNAGIRGKVCKKMYTHISKCKNDKTKGGEKSKKKKKKKEVRVKTVE